MLRITSKRLYLLNSTAATRDTVDIILIRISSDGPTVSLSGSPTVSPTTAASCAGEPFPWPSIAPDSMYFLPLSHAPPELLKV